MNAETIIQNAINEYQPVKILLLFSGGHDSMVSTHRSAAILDQMGLPYVVYHGDTSICIKETRQYVIDRCKEYGWELVIRSPRTGETYKDIIEKYGFPGPNPQAHGIMYRRLKERALRQYVTHECKSKPQARENVLLISGVRQSESNIRMGYKDAVKKDASRVWCAPCFYMQKHEQERYMQDHNITRNKVKDTLGISGECLCGCFADKGEYDKICQHYPDTADELDALHDIAVKNGHPWHWTQGPAKWAELHPEGQLEIFDLGMCSNCSRIKI